MPFLGLILGTEEDGMAVANLPSSVKVAWVNRDHPKACLRPWAGLTYQMEVSSAQIAQTGTTTETDLDCHHRKISH